MFSLDDHEEVANFEGRRQKMAEVFHEKLMDNLPNSFRLLLNVLRDHGRGDIAEKIQENPESTLWHSGKLASECKLQYAK